MKPVDRRAFALGATSLAASLALAGLSPRARAQGGAPVEGRDYAPIAKPVATSSDGRIEVVEFFWYGCPHCFALEPTLESWIQRQPADVAFRRVPVAFDARKETHQRIYYTWETLGLANAMQMNTFMRFHIQRKPIDSLDDMLAFAQQSNLDVAKVKAAWNSFGVQTRCAQAKRLADDDGIERTPEMAIQGRYTAVGGPGSLLATTDWLVDRVRRSA